MHIKLSVFHCFSYHSLFACKWFKSAAVSGKCDVVNRCLQADSWRVVSASDDRTIKVTHQIIYSNLQWKTLDFIHCYGTWKTDKLIEFLETVTYCN